MTDAISHFDLLRVALIEHWKSRHCTQYSSIALIKLLIQSLIVAILHNYIIYPLTDPADAKKALDMNTKTICGCQLKVAISSSDRAITNGDSEACHSCGQRGHIARYCPADKKDACHKCHEPGHWARDCPRTGGAGAVAPPGTVDYISRSQMEGPIFYKLLILQCSSFL